MMKNKHILLAALLPATMSAMAQTAVTFDAEDYRSIGVYDQWAASPFSQGILQGHAGVADNPDLAVDPVLGSAPNPSAKVVAVQRSRHASNAFGVRIDLKEPLRVTKQLQYIHVMAYLKDKPADSRMMVIGLGKRTESSWSWQTGEDEQFWAVTNAPVKAKAGWQDVVMSFKGFSYSREEKVDSGIDIYSLVIVPDLRSPHADVADWVAYFDEIVVDDNPAKRFSTDKYAVDFNKEAVPTRTDRALQSVGLTVDGNVQTFALSGKQVYYDHVANAVFSAKAGLQVKPVFQYKGAWMNAFVYADWGNDGVFSYGLNDNGTPAEGSDAVSYNAIQLDDEKWYKSDGTTVSNGNNVAAGVPVFTVPAETAAGFYRMRYRVDWSGMNPAGSATIISDGGAIADVTLDVHGETVSISASQLNGDIVLAEGLIPLQNYQTGYAQPVKIKVIPEKGFVQNGFTLKYGYNVNATDQLDDNGNPNWILVNVPAKAIGADSTYTIPAECVRGGYVSIMGDMQQVRHYAVRVEGAPNGQGGVIYAGVEYGHDATIDASQYFSADDVEIIPLEGYAHSVALDTETGEVVVTYKAVQAYRQITDLSELRNDMAYHIKAQSGEGYYAWNSDVTNTYVSLRGMTNSQYNGLPSNDAVARIYQEEVLPFDSTVVWQILKEGDAYYLYQPANECYVTRKERDYMFTSEKTALDIIRDNGDGTFSFHAGGNYSDGSTYFACICTNENPRAIRNWTWSDHGSKMFIIENPNIKVEDIVVGIDNVPVDNESATTKIIYNLNGQKLSSLPKSGVVIVNRKKVMVR